MRAYAAALDALTAINSAVLAVGRQLAWIAMALMVAVILAQVFWRYGLNSPLSWPEEAARGLMIWMMGVIAPSAWRWGGFVAIDMLPGALPPRAAAVLRLVILGLALAVLVFLLDQAWTQYNARMLFNSSGLNRLLQDSGINEALGTSLEFRTSTIFLAMSVLFAAMIAVSVELVGRAVGRLVWGPDAFPDPDMPYAMVGAAE